MKKKYLVPSKDKKDWINFTKQMGQIRSKEVDDYKENLNSSKIRKLDLHGLTLIEANKKVKKFIIKYFDLGYKKIQVITGKGIRSKAYNNVYRSEKMSILKNTVPIYIQSNEDLLNKIKKIENTPVKDGGDGAIFIYIAVCKFRFFIINFLFFLSKIKPIFFILGCRRKFFFHYLLDVSTKYHVGSWLHIFFENFHMSWTVLIVSGLPSTILLFLSFTQVIISLTKLTLTL